MVFHESEEPATFVVEARGWVGPRLVSEDLDRAEAFGRRHPEGWTYVADVRGVTFASPLNLWAVRRTRSLPNLRRYVVIATSPVLRLFIRLGWPVSRFHALVRDPAEIHPP